RVRPYGPGAPAAHRFRAGPRAGPRERPMIALLLAQTIAITGGTVFPVTGPKITNATVLIRDGKIAAVGAGVAVPSDATRIDAAGKWVTPGLSHHRTDGRQVAGRHGARRLGKREGIRRRLARGIGGSCPPGVPRRARIRAPQSGVQPRPGPAAVGAGARPRGTAAGAARAGAA